MPNSIETLASMVKLGDLPEEEKTKLVEAIFFNVEHEAEFFDQVNKVKLDENRTSITYTRTYLPKIDKTSSRYKNGLVEGVTPSPEQFNEADFSVPVTEMGWYFRFTNKTLYHSYHDLKSDFVSYLSNLCASYHDEKIADAYLSSANVVTNIDLLSADDLLTLNTILYKNNAKPFGDYYKLVVAPEIANKMLLAFKDLITHTTEKNALVTGEIGELCGFRVIRSRLQAFQCSEGKGRFVAYGKTMKGEYPVSIVAYDKKSENGQVIFKKPGQGGAEDALNQRGSIGLYVDGHGFYVFDDSICVTGIATISGLTPIAEFDNANRSNLVSYSVAASDLYPDVTFLELPLNETKTLVVKDEKGEVITANTLGYESTRPTIATVSESGVITAVKRGSARIVISKDDKVNVITVKVVA